MKRKYEVTIFAEGHVEYIVRVYAREEDEAYDRAKERFDDLFPSDEIPIIKYKVELLDMPSEKCDIEAYKSSTRYQDSLE